MWCKNESRGRFQIGFWTKQQEDNAWKATHQLKYMQIETGFSILCTETINSYTLLSDFSEIIYYHMCLFIMTWCKNHRKHQKVQLFCIHWDSGNPLCEFVPGPIGCFARPTEISNAYSKYSIHKYPNVFAYLSEICSIDLCSDYLSNNTYNTPL